MAGRLDWKWIGIGVAIMLALSVVVGLLAGLLMAPTLEGASDPQDVELSGGQAFILAVGNFLVFAVGGFIVGIKSAGRTIWEPGISAAIAVLIALLLAGTFSLGNLIIGGLVPFLAGVLGGWLGERRQEAGRPQGRTPPSGGSGSVS